MSAARKWEARRLHAVPSPADILREEIAAICKQMDRRYGNPPGTSERAVYFWWWPADEVHNVDVLEALHSDAVRFLLKAITKAEAPEQ
jgi:hypothetical protein